MALNSMFLSDYKSNDMKKIFTLFIILASFSGSMSLKARAPGGCEIGAVVAEVLPCNEAGYFHVVLNFEYANVSGEGFRINGNGNFYGNFAYGDLPVTIGPLLGDGSTVYEFVVTDLVYPDCSNWTAIDPVDCEGGGDCHLWEVQADPTDCNEEGYFWVVLDFNFENVGEEGFHVVGNGNNYGNFWYENLPVEIGPLLGDGETVYEFGVIDNYFEGCSGSTWIEPVDCEGGGEDCQIFDLVPTILPCNEEGMFMVSLNFAFSNPGEAGYRVVINEELAGEFSYEQVPAVVGPLQGDGVTEYHVTVRDNQSEGCFDETAFAVDCGASVPLANMSMQVTSCNGTAYYLQVDFDPPGQGGSQFIITSNLGAQGTYDYASLPITLGPFNTDGVTGYYLIIRDAQDNVVGNWRQMSPFTCETLGFEPVSPQELFKVFPNPASGSVNISYNGGGTATVALHDLLGSLLVKQSVMSRSTITLTDLRPGLYFYSLNIGSKRYTGKLTVK